MDYINLGLPSGTLWSDANEEGYFDFDTAKEKFGDNLPSIELWKELMENCKWIWNAEKKGYDVIGKNGNSIFLSANGYQSNTRRYYVGYDGYYWSSSLYTRDPIYAWNLSFDFNFVGLGYDYRYLGNSVRLVKQK